MVAVTGVTGGMITYSDQRLPPRFWAKVRRARRAA